MLERFLFNSELQWNRIEQLSGGERKRLYLLKILMQAPNILLLDEPTNHLDIPSKEILEDALRDYTGTVLYVSHDRYFINRTATRILELREKVLTNYIGNYDYYEEKKDDIFLVQHGDLVSSNPELSASMSASAGTAASASGPAVQDSGKSSARLEYEEQKASSAELRKKEKALKRVESQIEKLEAEITDIDTQLSDPANGTNVGLLLELSTKKEEAETKLEELYTEWEELQ